LFEGIIAGIVAATAGFFAMFIWWKWRERRRFRKLKERHDQLIDTAIIWRDIGDHDTAQACRAEAERLATLIEEEFK
jgi:hypothetical protein